MFDLNRLTEQSRTTLDRFRLDGGASRRIGGRSGG